VDIDILFMMARRISPSLGYKLLIGQILSKYLQSWQWSEGSHLLNDRVTCVLVPSPWIKWLNLDFFKRFLMPYAMDKLHDAAKNMNLQKKSAERCKMNQRPSTERLTELNHREPRSTKRLPAREVASDGLWKTLHSTIIICQITLCGSTCKVMLKICVWLLDFSGTT